MRKLKPDELCWCGSEKMYRDCHSEFDKKIEFYKKKHAKVPSRYMIKTPEQVAMIRKAAEVNRSFRLCCRTYKGRYDDSGDR